MLKLLRAHLAKLAASLAGLSLAACAPVETASTAAPKPALWKLADSDTTIYLFGTFHLLPKGEAWRTPAFEQVLASADELVLEVANVDDPMAAAQGVMKLGVSPGLPPLRERVPEGKRAALDAMIAESGIPGAVLDRLETWAAGLSLMGVMFQRLGLDPEAGVEKTLIGSWGTTRKPIRGLETAEEQLGFFDTLPEEAQRQFLVGVLDDPAKMRSEFAAMLSAWTRGDVDAIARTFNSDVTMSPELRDRLLRQRNARWATWLAQRLQQPGTVLVAVGAGHLAGPDSVQALLKARGLKTSRVQ